MKTTRAVEVLTPAQARAEHASRTTPVEIVESAPAWGGNIVADLMASVDAQIARWTTPVPSAPVRKASPVDNDKGWF